MRQGALDYVVKPDDPDGLGEAALEAAIRNAVEKTVLSSEVARLRTQVGEDPEGTPFWGPARRCATSWRWSSASPTATSACCSAARAASARKSSRASCIADRAAGSKPFVKVNAAALPSELLESELFGHERGAFTGAQTARIGKFEFANHGTLMLDEIGEMPAGLQAKLLHVLQDSEFTKLGSNRPVTVDVRIIAATNRDLEAMMRAGSFREDLYYRLQVIELHVPPLRERREEIPQLIEFFLVKYSERYGRPLRRPSDALRDALLELRVARQRARARERDQALRDPAGRRPGARRAEARARERRVDACRRRGVHRCRPPAQLAPPRHVAPPPAGRRSAAARCRTSRRPRSAAPRPRHRRRRRRRRTEHATSGPVSLPELAREAAMRAERAAIQQALDRFRWNRRKAADYLGVSYKTLLEQDEGVRDQRAAGLSVATAGFHVG